MSEEKLTFVYGVDRWERTRKLLPSGKTKVQVVELFNRLAELATLPNLTIRSISLRMEYPIYVETASEQTIRVQQSWFKPDVWLWIVDLQDLHRGHALTWAMELYEMNEAAYQRLLKHKRILAEESAAKQMQADVQLTNIQRPYVRGVQK